MPPDSDQRSLSNSESETTREQLEMYKREELEKLATELASTRAVSAKMKDRWGYRAKYGVLLAVYCLSSFNGDTTNTPPSFDDNNNITTTPPAYVSINISQTGEFYRRHEFDVHVNEGEIPRKRIVDINRVVYEGWDIEKLLA